MAKTHFGKLMEAWCHPNGKPFSLIMWPDTTIACIFSCITKQKVKKKKIIKFSWVQLSYTWPEDLRLVTFNFNPHS